MFLIGLFGSAHCLGMCGGFALTIGAVRPAFLSTLLNQLVYGVGRVFTYGFLGAAAGAVGGKLAKTDLPLIGAQQVLAILREMHMQGAVCRR